MSQRIKPFSYERCGNNQRFIWKTRHGKKTSLLTNIRLTESLSNRIRGRTTSRVERVMKNINMRINVGKWSPQGALNVNKIRLAYYYNGFDVD